MFDTNGIFPILTYGLLFLAAVLTTVRLLKGPSIPDRVVALDLFGMIIVGLIAASIFFSDEPLYLDVVLVFAVIAFFGTVAFARYLERQLTDDD